MHKFTIASVVAVAVAKARKQLKTVLMADFEEFTFPNLIDHFSINSGIVSLYDQRYWTNDSFYDKTNGPVFLYLCGEWTCSPPDTHMYPF